MQTDAQAWLQAQPLNAMVEVGAERICLLPRAHGAELRLQLQALPTPQQVRAALQRGFASARQYEAGLALSTDGESLLLSRWLPGVAGWPAACAALEELLDQAAAWRGAEPAAAPRGTARPPADRRADALRAALAKGLR